MIGGWVLDTSAMVGFALRHPYPQALVWSAVEESMVLAVPSVALAEAWAQTPHIAHDDLGVLVGLPETVVEELGHNQAHELGGYLAGRRAPVAAGHVAWSASRRGWPVATGQATVLRAIDPSLDIDELP